MHFFLQVLRTCYWKCSFPMNPHVHMLVGVSISASPSLSVCQNFLKGRDVSLPCLDRSTYYIINLGFLNTLPIRWQIKGLQRVCLEVQLLANGRAWQTFTYGWSMDSQFLMQFSNFFFLYKVFRIIETCLFNTMNMILPNCFHKSQNLKKMF